MNSEAHGPDVRIRPNVVLLLVGVIPELKGSGGDLKTRFELNTTREFPCKRTTEMIPFLVIL